MLAPFVCHYLPSARRRRQALVEEAVLAVIRDKPWGIGGVDIQEAVGCSWAALYLALARLEETRAVASRWMKVPGRQHRMRIYTAPR